MRSSLLENALAHLVTTITKTPRLWRRMLSSSMMTVLLSSRPMSSFASIVGHSQHTPPSFETCSPSLSPSLLNLPRRHMMRQTQVPCVPLCTSQTRPSTSDTFCAPLLLEPNSPPVIFCLSRTFGDSRIRCERARLTVAREPDGLRRHGRAQIHPRAQRVLLSPPPQGLLPIMLHECEQYSRARHP